MADRLDRTDLQAENIAKAPEYFNFAASFYLLAHEYLGSADTHSKNKHFSLGISILARGTNNLQGAVVLAEVGLSAEANSLVRAALECCFALGALRSGYPLLDRLQSAHDRARNTWGSFQLRNQSSSSLDREQLDRIKTQINETANGQRLNYEELAKNAGLSEYYEGMYRPLSNFGTHLSEGSLSQLLEPTENDAEHIIMAMHVVISAFALFLREVDKLFPIPTLSSRTELLINEFAAYLDQASPGKTSAI